MRCSKVLYHTEVPTEVIMILTSSGDFFIKNQIHTDPVWELDPNCQIFFDGKLHQTFSDVTQYRGEKSFELF